MIGDVFLLLWTFICPDPDCDLNPVLGVPDKDMAAMELGLAHSLSRYKLKFSPDKIDTMIVQVN